MTVGYTALPDVAGGIPFGIPDGGGRGAQRNFRADSPADGFGHRFVASLGLELTGISIPA